jgi:hypothetical protein
MPQPFSATRQPNAGDIQNNKKSEFLVSEYFNKKVRRVVAVIIKMAQLYLN